MKYDFSKKRLSNYLSKVGIVYIHIPELGVETQMRKNLTTKSAYTKLFEYYDKSILPNQKDKIEQIISYIGKYKNVVLTCFEKNPRHCHRYRISEFIRKYYHFESIVHI